MSSFIDNPNLPEGKVDLIICGGMNEVIIDYLKSRGVKILYSEHNCSVDRAVSKHADLSVLHLGGGRVITDKGQNRLSQSLENEGFEVIKSAKSVKGFYPDDCILNHTLIGNYIIGNSKIFDESVKEECRNLEVIHTNQGYCKCSVLVIDEKSVITDDESIMRSVAGKGIDCLFISKGDIFLDGHGYGFIGGASGKLSKNEIAFFGDITKHSDYSRIKEFICSRGMEIISFDFPLTDFGGIIPIKENI